MTAVLQCMHRIGKYQIQIEKNAHTVMHAVNLSYHCRLQAELQSLLLLHHRLARYDEAGNWTQACMRLQRVRLAPGRLIPSLTHDTIVHACVVGGPDGH